MGHGHICIDAITFNRRAKAKAKSLAKAAGKAKDMENSIEGENAISKHREGVLASDARHVCESDCLASPG